MKIKLTSNNANEQCDVFPCGSVRSLSYLEEIQRAGYPFVIIEETALKMCPACENEYEIKEDFEGDICARCVERYTKLDRI